MLVPILVRAFFVLKKALPTNKINPYLCALKSRFFIIKKIYNSMNDLLFLLSFKIKDENIT